MVGPWLTHAARVRQVSDATAALLTLADGSLARARALIAVHEVIEAQHECAALHLPAGRVEVA